MSKLAETKQIEINGQTECATNKCDFYSKQNPPSATSDCINVQILVIRIFYGSDSPSRSFAECVK